MQHRRSHRHAAYNPRSVIDAALCNRAVEGELWLPASTRLTNTASPRSFVVLTANRSMVNPTANGVAGWLVESSYRM